MTDAKTVAFIGLGVMGGPMARHLARRGHHVIAFNRTQEKACLFAQQQAAEWAATPREAAAGADFVFSCVGNDDDLRAVTLGPDGAFAGMKIGAVFVDHTTASAHVARNSTPRPRPSGWALSTRRFRAGRRAPRMAPSR